MNTFVIIFFITLSFVLYQPNGCSVTASDGSVYDLSELVALGPIRGSGDQAIWTYSVSICQNIIPCNICAQAGYCQTGIIDGQPQTYCVGRYSQIIGKPDNQGVELVYQEPTYGRVGRVIIRCDPTGLVNDITAISPSELNGYEFYFYSRAACSKNPTFPCAASASDGSSYDLSLIRDHGTLTATGNDGIYTYSVSLCRNLISCNSDCAQAGYCQTRTIQPLTSYCIGTYLPNNITGLPGGNGVELVYYEPTHKRLGRVFALCDPIAPLVSDITAVSPETLSGYEFYFVSSSACSLNSPDTCQVTASDGFKYDLSALEDQGPIIATDDVGTFRYTLSICKNAIPCPTSASGYCQTSLTSSNIYSVGNYGQIIGKLGGQGVELVYWSDEGRIGRVNITCNPGGPLVSRVKVISPTEITGYRFELFSSAACGTKTLN